MSGATAQVDGSSAVLEHGTGHRSHDRVGDDVGRIGKAVQEIAAFERRAERVDHVAVGGGLRRGDLVKASRVRLVVEIEHRPPREIRPPGFDVRPSPRGTAVEVHDRNAVDDREDAALAAENAVLNVIAIAPMEHRRHEFETAAAVRAPEDVERGNVHGLREGSLTRLSTESGNGPRSLQCKPRTPVRQVASDWSTFLKYSVR